MKAKLEELAAKPPDERLSLLEELDMARVLALENVQMFDVVCVQGNTGTFEGAEAAALQAQVSRATREAMLFVASIAERAAKVRATSEGTIDLELTDYLVHQIQAVLEYRLANIKNGPKILKKIAEDIKQIAVPKRMHGASPMVESDERAAELRARLAEMDTTVMGLSK